MQEQQLPNLDQDLAIIDAFRGYEELGEEPFYPDKVRFVCQERHYLLEAESAGFVALLMGAGADVKAAAVATRAPVHPLLCYTLLDDRCIRVQWDDGVLVWSAHGGWEEED